MRTKFFFDVASVSERRQGGALVSFKEGSRIFKQRAPKLTLSELTAPRGERYGNVVSQSVGSSQRFLFWQLFYSKCCYPLRF
ncbi:MAG: hypothetical protein COT39_02620 [Parcubacteria group bacterium CG08_land_8_20_14_0_20_48_21]|nr:MAG: hypothetical protein AUK21_02350 [Parcubacteria group bacterium CG2_30_48_51]PIS32801.1 MAG: hypothetical protein COT39_02620 [Parcubacteria group bacterium CG08_land_8_20_14_0_20_48_21]PIW79583.1 MAG: hypothetical protein COZ99_00155 [Parcubacteria group bacterium CG_4_8_14_3_um_filter_48_16]PIY78148.1 MAG: hypothetical protein COY83_01410 [Parcubacteria group bacterium CG_4_10_14_0_8_um_filter_48_154]PIZ76895.1 MAG: hypothetical protein COY03_04415 [bacterium CG_4_10_14_0_2_um_filter_